MIQIFTTHSLSLHQETNYNLHQMILESSAPLSLHQETNNYAFPSVLAMCTAKSTSLLEYPHSLSYQLINFTNVSFS